MLQNIATMSVRQRFIKEILEDEGRRLLGNQSKAMVGVLRSRSGRLISSRSISVGGSEAGGVLTFSHTAYERFLDMKRLRYGNTEVYRNRRIHNRFVFGHYNSIASRLAYGLTEDVVARIKEDFKNEK